MLPVTFDFALFRHHISMFTLFGFEKRIIMVNISSNPILKMVYLLGT